jgi:hypothetical protein
MKASYILILYLLLFSCGKCETNSYDYSSYSAISTNTNLSSETLTSTTSDQSVVYITSSGITISSSTLQKSSGDSSNVENSEFYGVNAAVLVQGGEVTITDGEITTAAKGANAVCATNSGKVTITGTKITSTSSGSGRGLHSTYGGSITASGVTISSTGGSCATLATDRGEGTVTCTDCTLSTGGAGSPLIYSTGTITVSSTSGTASAAQMVVVEGKNTATVQENSSLKCTGVGNRNNVDDCGIFLYQSMSGDADTGTSTFNCKSSSLEILSSSSVYSSAPMFFITNTDSIINLEGCTFTYGSGIFLNAAGTSEWGTSGSNGGDVTLTLTNQNVEGDFVVNSDSSLIINMVNSSIKGKINNAKSSSTISVNLDAASTITLTGNSYVSSLSNSDTTGSNIIKGSYSFADYNGNEYTGTTSTSTTSSSSASTDDNQNTSTSSDTQTSLDTSVTTNDSGNQTISNDTDNNEDDQIIKINLDGKYLTNYILFMLILLLF